MAWEEALETVVGRTGIERYRWLTSDDNPDAHGRERYRAEMVRLAARPLAPVSYPPVAVQARNLWRSIKAFVASGGKLAPKSVRAERQATCNGCPFWRGRCLKCGCTGLKLYAAVAVCPDDPPRWLAVEADTVTR
jgi:hypothetical protein